MAQPSYVLLALAIIAGVVASDPPTLPSCANDCVSQMFPSCADSVPAQCVCDAVSSNPEMGMAYGQCVFMGCGMSTAGSIRTEILSFCGIPDEFGGGSFPGASSVASGVPSSTVISSTEPSSATAANGAPASTTAESQSSSTTSTSKQTDTTDISPHSGAAHQSTQSNSHSPTKTSSTAATETGLAAASKEPAASPTGSLETSASATPVPSTDALTTGAKVGIGIGIAIIALLLLAILILLIRRKQIQQKYIPFTALEKAFPSGSPTLRGGAGGTVSSGSSSSIPIYMDANPDQRPSPDHSDMMYHEADSRPQPMYYEVDGSPVASYELPGTIAKHSYRSMLVELPLTSPSPLDALITENYAPEQEDDGNARTPSSPAPDYLRTHYRSSSSGQLLPHPAEPIRHSQVASLVSNRRSAAQSPSHSPARSLTNRISDPSRSTPSSHSPSDRRPYSVPSAPLQRSQHSNNARSNSSAEVSSPTDSSSISPVESNISPVQPARGHIPLQARAVRLLRLDSSVPRAQDDFVSPLSAAPR